MKKNRIIAVILFIAATLSGVFLIGGCGGGGGGTSILPATTAQREYVGSTTCNQCHKDKYDSFIRTGHPYKFRTLATLQQQTVMGLPVPPADADIIANLNTSNAGYGLTAANFSSNVGYAVGGYKFKVRFISANGYIYTGSKGQYNFADGSWVKYNDPPAGNSPTKPYNYACFRCHTTGPMRGTDDGKSFADSAGTGGSFEFGGVQCEACHGPGSRHANFRESMINPELTAKGLPQNSSLLCGKCHYRNNPGSCDEEPTSDPLANYNASNPDGLGTGAITDTDCAAGTWDTDVIIASGGNIKHHEQFQEFVKGKHGYNSTTGRYTLECVTCHDPHQPADETTGIRATCDSCHPKARTDITKNSAGHGTLECVDCHMPRMVKNAINTATINTADATTLKLGDIRTHIIKIAASDTMFNGAGSAVNIDGATGHAYLGVREACQNCHFTGNTYGATARTSATLQTAVTNVINVGGHDFQ